MERVVAIGLGPNFQSPINFIEKSINCCMAERLGMGLLLLLSLLFFLLFLQRDKEVEFSAVCSLIFFSFFFRCWFSKCFCHILLVAFLVVFVINVSFNIFSVAWLEKMMAFAMLHKSREGDSVFRGNLNGKERIFLRDRKGIFC